MAEDKPIDMTEYFRTTWVNGTNTTAGGVPGITSDGSNITLAGTLTLGGNSITPSGTGDMVIGGPADSGGGQFVLSADGGLHADSAQGASVDIDADGNVAISGSSIEFESTPILMPFLATSDPHNAGQLWNHLGILTISAG